MSKCSIFHNILKYMIFQRHQKALLWSKGLTPTSSYGHMQTGPQLASLIPETGEAGDRSTGPGLQGEWFIHYTTMAPVLDEKYLL